MLGGDTPPCFSYVWQPKDLRAAVFVCVAGKGFTGALFGCVAAKRVTLDLSNKLAGREAKNACRPNAIATNIGAFYVCGKAITTGRKGKKEQLNDF